MSEICCTFAAQKLKQQNFETMFGVKSSNQPISGQFAEDFVKNLIEARKQPRQDAGTISKEKWDSLHTINELDASLKNIIYKERLIDPDWKEEPMRPWSEVYDEMCCEVGHAYGLNDIREA